MPCKIPPQITEYMEQVETGAIRACKEQHQLVALVRNVFVVEDIYVDEKQLSDYLGLVKYFPFGDLFPWEKFVLGLHCCVYRKGDGRPRWPDLFLLIGRGAGKDGYIGFEGLCLISPYNGISHYDVDICANSEMQAKAPFDDVYEVLEKPENRPKLERFFDWNKQDIVCKKTKAKLKFRTNNPRGKDGLRSGIVVFNEIHQYEDYANINVFTTGLGKKAHPRRTYATTNGDVRDGPLDHMLNDSLEILKGARPDNGWLPFICRLDDKKEIDDSKMWEKANPSLPYMEDLRIEIEKEYISWKAAPSQFTAFPTKRMNIPDGNPAVQVTSWENILATNKPLPDLSGRSCVVGLDFASVSDFAAAGCLFRDGDVRYWIPHAWLCAQSPDIPRIKAPWREWEKVGLLTVVDDVEISPDLIVDWIAEQGARYNILRIALDNFRYALVAGALKRIGFNAKEAKNVKLIRPSDEMIISPVIESVFANQRIVWGDNPLMRWATNNTKMIRTGINKDTGNMTYGKIEPKSRKTDPFMAFVAAMTLEEYLISDSAALGAMANLGVWTY